MPLDDNFPTFHISPSRSSPTTATITHSANGSPATPVYLRTLTHPSPATYALSLTDALFPDILYGSLLTSPEFPPRSPGSQDPSTPPKVILPAEIAIHLFQPDATVPLVHHHSTLRGSSWEFELPKHSFPPPTGAGLDSVYPPPSEHLPHLTFRWRKESGLLSRTQLMCYLTANGTSNAGKKKKKGGDEPDIPVAMYTGVGDRQGRGELTIYESNFRRVELEDYKGLEVVLLLSAMSVSDVWFVNTREVFELAFEVEKGKRGRKGSGPQVQRVGSGGPAPGQQNFANRAQQMHQHPNANRPPPPPQPSSSYPPEKVRPPPPPQPTPPPPQRQATIAREQAQIRNMLQEEEMRERARKQAAVDAETERLKRLYSNGGGRGVASPVSPSGSARYSQSPMSPNGRYPPPQQQQHRTTTPAPRVQTPQLPHRQQHPHPQQRPHPQHHSHPRPQQPQRPPIVGGGGGYLSPTGGQVFGAQGVVQSNGKTLAKADKRRSFMGLKFGESKEEKEKKKKLVKKGSSVF